MHELTKTEPNLETLITTARDSYIYVCPQCQLENRYAVPENKEEVFCDGENFGTKVQLTPEIIIEVKSATALKDTFITKAIPEYLPTEVLALDIVEFDVNDYEYKLTELGQQVIEVLR